MVNVFVTPEFIFTHGQVTGRIVIDPDSIINTIYDNSIFSFRDPKIMAVKKAVAKKKNSFLEIGTEPPMIYLDSGVVTKNYIQMDLLEAADLLFNYLGYFEEDLKQDTACKDLYEFLQKCKNIEYPSQMANLI